MAFFTSISKTIGFLLDGNIKRVSEKDICFNRNPEEYGEFPPYYHRHIFPLIDGYEEQRARKLVEYRKRLWISIFGLIPLLLGAVYIYKNYLRIDQIDFLFFGMFLVVTLAYKWCRSPVKEYKLGVKTEVFPKVFNYYAEQNIATFLYQAEALKTVYSLKESGIIPGYDDEYTEDYVKGDYKGVTLELFEAKLTKESRDSKGRRRTITVFIGLFVLMSMNKNFTGHTIIKRDSGTIGNWFARKLSTGNKEPVKLEDPVFEDKFEVYSDNQIEARYLLSTSFMERLLSLSNLFDNANLQAAFYNNKLLLMIPSSHNHFETGSIFEPATFESEIKTILDEVKQLLDIVDILKLNEQTRL